MPALGRDALLTITALRKTTVDVPELGGAIILREMTGRDLVLLQQRSGRTLEDLDRDDFVTVLNLLAWMLRYSWIDDAGDLVMDDGDVEKIINMPVGAMTTLVGLISAPLTELNGLAKEATAEAKKN